MKATITALNQEMFVVKEIRHQDDARLNEEVFIFMFWELLVFGPHYAKLSVTS